MTLKEEIEEILHPERIKLHPPRASLTTKEQIERFAEENPLVPVDYGYKTVERPIVSEKEYKGHLIQETGITGDADAGGVDSKPTIDFNAMANASEFQRFVYWIRTGKVFRGSNDALKEDLWKTQKDIEMIQNLKKIDPNAKNFGNVINEFKSKVEGLKKRNESIL